MVPASGFDGDFPPDDGLEQVAALFMPFEDRLVERPEHDEIRLELPLGFAALPDVAPDALLAHDHGNGRFEEHAVAGGLKVQSVAERRGEDEPLDFVLVELRPFLVRVFRPSP